MIQGGCGYLHPIMRVKFWSEKMILTRGGAGRIRPRFSGLVRYKVETLLPINGEIHENVRPSYCGMYTTYFKDCIYISYSFFHSRSHGQSRDGLCSYSQICPNFLRYNLTLAIYAKEEMLEFSLEKLLQLRILKRNNGFLGTMLP